MCRRAFKGNYCCVKCSYYLLFTFRISLKINLLSHRGIQRKTPNKCKWTLLRWRCRHVITICTSSDWCLSYLICPTCVSPYKVAGRRPLVTPPPCSASCCWPCTPCPASLVTSLCSASTRPLSPPRPALGRSSPAASWPPSTGTC